MRRALSITAGIGIAGGAALMLAAPGTHARWQATVTTASVSLTSGDIGVSTGGGDTTYAISEAELRAAVADGEYVAQIAVDGVNDGDGVLLSSLGPVTATDNGLVRVLTAELTVGTDSCVDGTGTAIYSGTASGLAGFTDATREIVPADAARGTLIYCVTLRYPEGTGLSTSTTTATGSGTGAIDSAGATTTVSGNDTDDWYGTALPGDELYAAEIVFPFTATITEGATP